MEEQSNEALWYVVHTYSGYENKVANDLQTMVENRRLQDLICDIKVPTEMVPEIKDGKERMVEHIALREAIDQLPEKERMTILLRYFKGLTQEQTARILGVSQVQISRLERRGLADLRRLLDG